MNSTVEKASSFLGLFNGTDVEAVIAEFSDDAVYHDPQGGTHEGNAAIRAALRPIFEGALGKLRYEVRDLFGDGTGRAVGTWTLTAEAADGSLTQWDGIDVLSYADEKLIDKRCYMRPMEPS